ncbi:hypothetical protein JKY72_01595 [Candidatus Gracilibacteria bacterium]|nr:hypothetical protein [Candidatus Gracilibacteria bacterium]
MPYIHFVHAYEAGIIPELPSELYLERRRVDHGDAKDSVTQNAFAAALARNPSQHDVMTLKMAIANLHLHKVPMDRVETHTVGEDIPLITFYLEGYIFNGPSEFLAVMSQIYHETWTYTTNDGIEVDEKDYISPKPCKCETIERLTCKHPLWMPRDDPACIQVHEPIDSDIDSDSDSDSDSDTDM